MLQLLSMSRECTTLLQRLQICLQIALVVTEVNVLSQSVLSQGVFS